MPTIAEPVVKLWTPHQKQLEIMASRAKRKVIRAGRRSGKTFVAAIIAIEGLIEGRRILYTAPTIDQVEAFWYEVCRAPEEPIRAGVYIKNETEHSIERPGTLNRIRAKTAWNADTMRGDYADLLIMDEFQLMNEDAWEHVGAPMLLDNNGAALFIYTPPSLHSIGISKARDPKHAAKMFKMAKADTSGRWAAFHFTSGDNPHISQTALADITKDMSSLAYRQEILAEDIEVVPGALWTRELIDKYRMDSYPELYRVVIGVDPPGGSAECGIIVAGITNKGIYPDHIFILGDYSIRDTPDKWAEVIIEAYDKHMADRVIGEQNFGGDMVESTVKQAALARKTTISYEAVRASRGKAIRAEPVVAMYEQGRIHHIGNFPILEEEMLSWVPGQSGYSPNRMDALVWAVTELMPKTAWASEVEFVVVQNLRPRGWK